MTHKINKREKILRAECLIDRYMATGKMEFGPVWYAYYGALMGSIGFDQACAAFDARYPIMADERIAAAYA